jgi:hypothetical protein
MFLRKSPIVIVRFPPLVTSSLQHGKVQDPTRPAPSASGRETW